MHEIIEARLRSAPPVGAVVRGSTPVVSFGDATRAHVATIGINPSRLEFLKIVDGVGELLGGSAARFVSLMALGRDGLREAPQEHIARVYDGCCTYFERNPYRQWFDLLEGPLQALGASYYQGSAAHLDLAQWATDPVWGELSSADRLTLINDGREFLQWQLAQPQLQLALVNGRTVLDAFARWSGLEWTVACEFPGLQDKVARVYSCVLPNGLRVLGWSTNLQSSRGVTMKFRHDLGATLARLQSKVD